MAFKIKLVKSLAGRHDKHIATAYSLGLHKIGDETTQPDKGRGLVRFPDIPRLRAGFNRLHECKQGAICYPKQGGAKSNETQ